MRRTEKLPRNAEVETSRRRLIVVIEIAARCIRQEDADGIPLMPGDSDALPQALATGATRASTRDDARLRDAFVRHYAGIWRFLRRLGVPGDRVDDAAQHAFLVALEALPRIAPGSERAFLYATAVRTAHGIRRRVEREIATVDFEARSSSAPSAEELTDRKRARELLDRILAQIELDARAVFVLFEIEGFTLPQIADLLAIPLGTATSRLRRARERFRELAQAASGRQS
jgi:RNA polymerase sigma-70 factor, ECF subfamily